MRLLMSRVAGTVSQVKLALSRSAHHHLGTYCAMRMCQVSFTEDSLLRVNRWYFSKSAGFANIPGAYGHLVPTHAHAKDDQMVVKEK